LIYEIYSRFSDLDIGVESRKYHYSYDQSRSWWWYLQKTAR